MFGENWYAVKDGDPMAVDLYRRHYSCPGKPAHIYRRYGFSGQGESMVLVTVKADALFVWNKQKDELRDDEQKGVNCSVFRNESNTLSSELILEAEQLAWNRWPGERLYTYVDPNKIKSDNPGYCFKMAGWKQCGITKVNKLLIFEKRFTK